MPARSRYILTLDISRYMSRLMKHTDRGGNDRHSKGPRDQREHRRGHHHHHRNHGSHGRRGGRAFDYGELRLLTLAMIGEQPRHGYELMRAIEDRMGGSYSPSPGVIYPTLSWLEDMGYAQVTVEESGRKRYLVTAEGKAFLEANRTALDDLLARIGSTGASMRDGVPAPVTRGMENLKLALRLRLRRGPLDQATAEAIAVALDTAAQAVERS
jgi:DNA-binding PadR family transcriptional regulator